MLGIIRDGSAYRVLAKKSAREADKALEDIHFARARPLCVRQRARILVQHNELRVALEVKSCSKLDVLGRAFAQEVRRVLDALLHKPMGRMQAGSTVVPLCPVAALFD